MLLLLQQLFVLLCLQVAASSEKRRTVGMVTFPLWDTTAEPQEDLGGHQVCVLRWRTRKAGFELQNVGKVIEGTKLGNTL